MARDDDDFMYQPWICEESHIFDDKAESHKFDKKEEQRKEQ